MYPENTAIYVSKWKTALLIIGAALFVFLGILFINDPEKFAGDRRAPLFILLIGIAAVVFFGAALVFGLLRVFQKRAVYVFNSDGLVYDTRNPDTHTIRWAEIRGFEILKIKSAKTILVHLFNPQEVVTRQTSAFKRKLMQMSVNQYHTPISINTNSLQISHKEMLELLVYYHQAGLAAQSEKLSSPV